MSVTPPAAPVPGNTGRIRRIATRRHPAIRPGPRPAFIILSRGEFPDTYPPAYPPGYIQYSGYPAGGFLSRIPAYDTYPYIHIHIIRPAAYSGQIDDNRYPAGYPAGGLSWISFIFISYPAGGLFLIQDNISGRRLILDIIQFISYPAGGLFRISGG